MTLPGFTVTEIDPVEDLVEGKGQRWAGLQAHFPATFPGHSPVQEFYFDNDQDIAGGFAAIQYVYGMLQADVIMLPTKRRAYRCDGDGPGDGRRAHGVDRPQQHPLCVTTVITTGLRDG